MRTDELLDEMKSPDNYEDQDVPQSLSEWKHTNGIIYTVVCLANVGTLYPEKHPVTVVYRGPNKKIWTRPLSDWHRSMKKV